MWRALLCVWIKKRGEKKRRKKRPVRNDFEKKCSGDRYMHSLLLDIYKRKRDFLLIFFCFFNELTLFSSRRFLDRTDWWHKQDKELCRFFSICEDLHRAVNQNALGHSYNGTSDHLKRTLKFFPFFSLLANRGCSGTQSHHWHTDFRVTTWSSAIGTDCYRTFIPDDVRMRVLVGKLIRYFAFFCNLIPIVLLKFPWSATTS